MKNRVYEENIDKLLQEELLKIKNHKKFVVFIFNYCELKADKEKLLSYILSGHHERKQVLLMASQIGIESGSVEGELEE